MCRCSVLADLLITMRPNEPAREISVEKVLPASLNYCHYLIYPLKTKWLCSSNKWLCSSNYWNRPIYLARWFSKRWLTWRPATVAVLRGTTSATREVNWTFTIIQGGLLGFIKSCENIIHKKIKYFFSNKCILKNTKMFLKIIKLLF